MPQLRGVLSTATRGSSEALATRNVLSVLQSSTTIILSTYPGRLDSHLTYKGLFIVGGNNDVNCGVLVQDVAKVVEIRSRSAMELKTKAD